MPAVVSKKIKAFNPQRGMKKSGPARKPARKKTSKNPPGLMTLGFALGNPQKEKKSMKKRNSHKKAAPTSNKRAPAKKKNPWFKKSSAPVKHRRKSRNPSAFSKPVDNLKFGAVALAGLVAARQIPQLALGANNSGLIGYAANLGVATLAGLGVGYATSKQLGWAVAIGGSLYTVSRILTERASPVGKYFSLAGVGDAAPAGMGDLEAGYFPVPVVTDANNNPMIPEAILRAAVAASVKAVDQQTQQRQIAASQASAAPMAMAGLPSRFHR